MVYLCMRPGTEMDTSDGQESTPSSGGVSPVGNAVNNRVPKNGPSLTTEDDVDQHMWKQDGRIQRQRNEQL